MESQAAQKLERQREKVERKRFVLQLLGTGQIVVGPPAMFWMLFEAHGNEAPVASVLAVLGLLWTVVGVTCVT